MGRAACEGRHFVTPVFGDDCGRYGRGDGVWGGEGRGEGKGCGKAGERREGKGCGKAGEREGY